MVSKILHRQIALRWFVFLHLPYIVHKIESHATGQVSGESRTWSGGKGVQESGKFIQELYQEVLTEVRVVIQPSGIVHHPQERLGNKGIRLSVVDIA